MLLVVDVGNTNIVMGLYSGSVLLRSWRMGTRQNQTSDEMGVLLNSWLALSGAKGGELKSVIISSVVPDIMYSLTNAIRKYFEISPMIVNRDMNLGIDLNIHNRELGADRIVNCVAAYSKFGGPVIIIDYGTATTYDAMSKNGEFVTGITAPGIKISADALFSRAALLGKVELILPPSIVVKSTTESVQAGILYGAIGQTEYIVNLLKQALGEDEVVVVATGGLANTVANGSEIFDHIVPGLTLEGLRLIHDMNKECI
ncbi:MAG: type III pantothenate kinase [Clostridiales bacterium]|jgi:type III pantothenate kinase|nr:type III pantothenate kinase [Clostridiales bacterium]